MSSFDADVNTGASADCAEPRSLERVPGEFFRALAGLYMQRLDRPRRALAVLLLERLNKRIQYHLATMERQLAGSVKSIPSEVERTMRELVVRDLGLQTDAEIDAALDAVGASVAPALRRPAYIATDRVVLLGALLQRVGAGRSRRAVACCLAERLRDDGLSLGVNALQNILRGKQPLARREVHEQLLLLLHQHGIRSEADAQALWRGQHDDIVSYMGDRTFEPAERLADLVRLWRLHRREASSLDLARVLQAELRKRGMILGLSRIQDALDGRARRVRRALVIVMDELLRREPAASRAVNPERAASRMTDLFWVLAQPIAFLARGWILAHAGESMNKLAILVTRTARRMGYAVNRISVLGILCGHKQRTRGIVYRAALIVVTGRRSARVPQEHVVQRVRGGSEPIYGHASVDETTSQPHAESKPSPLPPSRACAIRSHSDALSAHFERIGRTQTLDRQAERELARRWKEDGDQWAADALVQSHLRLVVKVARRYRHHGIPLEDLISEGQIGLLVAVHRFDLTRERRLMTYATFWIRAYVQNYVAKTRSIVGRSRATQSGKLRGGASLHPDPFPGDLSLDEPVRRDADVSRVDALADTTATPEERVIDAAGAAELAAEISRILQRLSWEERLLVEDHFMGGMPLANVARRLGISRRCVDRLASRLQNDLAEALRPLRPAA